jgi:hypothetical protein
MQWALQTPVTHLATIADTRGRAELVAALVSAAAREEKKEGGISSAAVWAAALAYVLPPAGLPSSTWDLLADVAGNFAVIVAPESDGGLVGFGGHSDLLWVPALLEAAGETASVLRDNAGLRQVAHDLAVHLSTPACLRDGPAPHSALAALVSAEGLLAAGTLALVFQRLHSAVAAAVAVAAQPDGDSDEARRAAAGALQVLERCVYTVHSGDGEVDKARAAAVAAAAALLWADPLEARKARDLVALEAHLEEEESGSEEDEESRRVEDAVEQDAEAGVEEAGGKDGFSQVGGVEAEDESTVAAAVMWAGGRRLSALPPAVRAAVQTNLVAHLRRMVTEGSGVWAGVAVADLDQEGDEAEAVATAADTWAALAQQVHNTFMVCHGYDSRHEFTRTKNNDFNLGTLNCAIACCIVYGPHEYVNNAGSLTRSLWACRLWMGPQRCWRLCWRPWCRTR